MIAIKTDNKISNTGKRRLVLAACCLTNLCIGSLYAWSVFSTPMLTYLNGFADKQITSLAIVFTLANAVGPVTMIAGGKINERLGSRAVILLGGVMFGASMFLTGFARSIIALLVSYGLGVGLSVGMVYGCAVSSAIRLFPDKRGLAGGVTTASYGLAPVLVSPVANMLLTRVGICLAFQILGVAMGALICLCALAMRRGPDDPLRVKTGAKGEKRDGNKTWRDMVKSPVFYLMMCMLLCGAFSGLMAVSQASPLAQNLVGMTAPQAAVAVSVLALFNSAGRIFAGLVSDKIGYTNTLRMSYIGTMAGMGCLMLCSVGDIALFCIGISIIGVSFGALMGIYPGFTAAQFGAKYNNVNYGVVFVGFALAGYFGPAVISDLYVRTGEYLWAFVIAIVFAAAGCGITLRKKALLR